MTKLSHDIPVFNVDGTKNSAGNITHSMELIIDYNGHREKITAEVTDIGKNLLILGYTWLAKHNLEIDWQTGSVKLTRCPHTCYLLSDQPVFLRTLEEKEVNDMPYMYRQLRAQEALATKEKTVAELVPRQY